MKRYAWTSGLACVVVVAVACEEAVVTSPQEVTEVSLDEPLADSPDEFLKLIDPATPYEKYSVRERALWISSVAPQFVSMFYRQGAFIIGTTSPDASETVREAVVSWFERLDDDAMASAFADAGQVQLFL